MQHIKKSYAVHYYYYFLQAKNVICLRYLLSWWLGFLFLCVWCGPVRPRSCIFSSVRQRRPFLCHWDIKFYILFILFLVSNTCPMLPGFRLIFQFSLEDTGNFVFQTFFYILSITWNESSIFFMASLSTSFSFFSFSWLSCVYFYWLPKLDYPGHPLYLWILR